MRVTGDETQGTMGRRDTSNSFSPSRLPCLPSRASFHRERERERERDVWVQGRVGVVLNCTMGLDGAYGIIVAAFTRYSF